jgi:hypothetical protein
MSAQPRESISVDVVSAGTGNRLAASVIYDLYFHGPAYQVITEAWSDEGRGVGQLQNPLPDHHIPQEETLVAGPRLAELCFQTAGLIGFADTDRVCLPRRVSEIKLYGTVAERAGVLCFVERQMDGDFVATVMDESGSVMLEMSGYTTIESPSIVDGQALGALRDVLEGGDTDRTT